MGNLQLMNEGEKEKKWDILVGVVECSALPFAGCATSLVFT